MASLIHGWPDIIRRRAVVEGSQDTKLAYHQSDFVPSRQNQALATHNTQDDTMKKLLVALLPVVSRVLKARQAKKQGTVPAASGRLR